MFTLMQVIKYLMLDIKHLYFGEVIFRRNNEEDE